MHTLIKDQKNELAGAKREDICRGRHMHFLNTMLSNDVHELALQTQCRYGANFLNIILFSHFSILKRN